MKVLSSFFFTAIVLFVVSCTPQKGVITNYLENARDTSGKEMVNLKPPVVQRGDILSIKVFSMANGDEFGTDNRYNLQEQNTGSGSTSAGFQVDQNGNIVYPQIGSLYVQGLSREQVADTIKSRLQHQLKEPSGVIVRFLNFKVSVLGEVNNPGSFTLPSERVTILEALGLSGDITEFGKKNNVMVIREKDSVIERGTIDLTSSSMFSSPYYRLQQNDIVFVETNARKIKQEQRQETAQQIGIASSIITAIALILNFIK